jgi:hypothetical protein
MYIYFIKTNIIKKFTSRIGFSIGIRDELKLHLCDEKSDYRCDAGITTSGASTGTEALI